MSQDDKMTTRQKIIFAVVSAIVLMALGKIFIGADLRPPSVMNLPGSHP